jgi:hypothetical protein
MRKYIAFTLLLLVQSLYAFCQRPPEEFFSGLNVINTNPTEAKQDFLISIQKAPDFHGSYHFLGVIYLDENKLDSAVWEFKKSIELNTANVNHTREMSYVRLINTYLLQRDFQHAFAIGCEAFQLYPDNQNVARSLGNACKWSFYIKYDHLDPTYLSPDIKPEYVVNSIPEEYLILPGLKVNGSNLQMMSQSLVTKKDGNFDVFDCRISDTTKKIKVIFRINWDMNKYFGGITPPTQPVIDDANSPVYEKAGAMLVADRNTDLKAVLNKLTQK